MSRSEAAELLLNRGMSGRSTLRDVAPAVAAEEEERSMAPGGAGGALKYGPEEPVEDDVPFGPVVGNAGLLSVVGLYAPCLEGVEVLLLLLFIGFHRSDHARSGD